MALPIGSALTNFAGERCLPINRPSTETLSVRTNRTPCSSSQRAVDAASGAIAAPEHPRERAAGQLGGVAQRADRPEPSVHPLPAAARPAARPPAAPAL